MITDKDDAPLAPDTPQASGTPLTHDAPQALNDTLFRLTRAVLFKMDPERAHDIALRAASHSIVKSINRKRYATNGSAVTCMGLDLPNCVGLAAGLDKNGDYIDALGAMGFGFIEIGTITPKPQQGNPQPRLFRLKEHNALINRMGFNNMGVDHLVKQAEKRQFKGCLGINIGKNASTAIDDAENDYLTCLEKVYASADYITVNVSSPNTQGLRDLQHGERLRSLLDCLKNAQSNLATRHGQYKPVVVKIAPDMSDAELSEFCTTVLEFEIDGVIAGNTTSERSMVAGSQHATETGGLSGAPIRALADDRMAVVATQLDGKAALIGVGGIFSGGHAALKRQLGADLVQLYTGLIYHGPALVRDCIRKTT